MTALPVLADRLAEDRGNVALLDEAALLGLRGAPPAVLPVAAQRRIQMLREEVNDYYGHFRVTPDLIELRNLLESADLIVRSALHRKESRGLHYTIDYPETAAEAVDTVLVP